MNPEPNERIGVCELLGFLVLGCVVGKVFLEVFIAVRRWMEVAS